MWKAAAGANIKLNTEPVEDDDWETDPDFVNDVTEEEQRWGSNTVKGSGRTAGAIDMEKLRRETEQADHNKKKKEQDEGPNASFGYGGKFGVEKDRMDQSAFGHDYIAKVEKHVSQKDYSTGFGGKYGVQSDRVDKSAMSWDHKEKVEKHTSQKDYVSGFGGKFGVEKDRQDKSAMGWDHIEKVEKHESQKDYSRGFGGKFGVQADRQDKSAVGWDHHEAPQKHESQTDHKIGFGGKFGVQKDRMDKSASTFDEEPTKVGTNYSKVKPDIGAAKPSDLRAKFERLASDEGKAASATSSPTKRGSIQSKAAVFNTRQEEKMVTHSSQEKVTKLDQSKMAFLNQTTESTVTTSAERSVPGHLNKNKIEQFTISATSENEIVCSNSSEINQELKRSVPGQLDKNKMEQFTSTSEHVSSKSSELNEELKELRQMQQEKQHVPQIEPEDEIIAQKTEELHVSEQKEESIKVDDDVEYQEDDIVDTGLTATALYDYQAAAEDEISFDPEDIISHVERIDEGWWRGLCKGKYGLFPANYVQLHQ